jgi:hypothetical protein
MSLLLQVWGGLFYLLNKVFLSVAERSERNNRKKKKTWRVTSWVVYLLGTPSWIFLFIKEHNWIAAALEAGGIPSMIIGLIITIKGKGKEPMWLNYIAIISIVIGLGYSWYDFNGIRTFHQFAEIVMIAAFLIGTYQIAQEKLSGYVWFMIMNGACMLLMYLDHYPWLVVQQIVSVSFVIDAYFVKKKKT